MNDRNRQYGRDSARIERERKNRERHERGILLGTALVLLVVMGVVALGAGGKKKEDIKGTASSMAGSNTAGSETNGSKMNGSKTNGSKTTESENKSSEKTDMSGENGGSGVKQDVSAVLEGDKLYILEAGGTKTPISGWVKVDDKWYCGEEDGTPIKDRIVTRDGKDYYLQTDGSAAVGKTILADGLPYKADEMGVLTPTEGWGQVDGKWHYLEADRTWTDPDRSGSLPTIDKYLGCSGLAGWMMEHFNDYYFKTNFSPMTDYINEPEKLLRPYGDYGEKSTMNCTGFVAHLLKSAGGDLSKVSAMGKNGGYTNADNYVRLATQGYVQYYTFDSVEELLASGKARKGDILYLEPDWKPGADCHIGIYWGDTGSEDMFWNQNWDIKNDVTNIRMDDPIVKIYLLPINGY